MTAPNTNYDQVNAVTRRAYVPKMYDNIFQANPLLNVLKEKSYVSIDGGTTIVVPLNYALNNAGGWYAGSDTLDLTDVENMTGANYNWKQIYEAVSITRRDQLMNQGTARVLDLVKTKMKIAEKTIRDRMGTALWNTGSNSKAMAGIGQILATNSNTVGGISQTNYSWWQSQLDTTTTTFSISALQTQFNAAAIDNDAPTHLFSLRANYNRYHNLLQPQMRYADAKMADAGFQNLLFHGAPWMVDNHATANYVLGLNINYMHLFYHPEEDFRFVDFVKPINQNATVGELFWMGNLGSSNNRTHFLFTALAA